MIAMIPLRRTWSYIDWNSYLIGHIYPLFPDLLDSIIRVYLNHTSYLFQELVNIAIDFLLDEYISTARQHIRNCCSIAKMKIMIILMINYSQSIAMVTMPLVTQHICIYGCDILQSCSYTLLMYHACVCAYVFLPFCTSLAVGQTISKSCIPHKKLLAMVLEEHANCHDHLLSVRWSRGGFVVRV